MADNGTIRSGAMLTAAPVEAAPRPLFAIAFVARLRTACASYDGSSVLASTAVVTVSVMALVACVPLIPPAVLTKILLSASGSPQYRGGASMMTLYWFRVV